MKTLPPPSLDDRRAGPPAWPRSLVLLVMLANLVLGGLLLGAVVWLGMHVAHVLLLFTLGSFVAYALFPLVDRAYALTRRRLSWGASVFLVLAGLALLVGLGITIAVRPTSRQLQELATRFPAYRTQGHALAEQLDAWMADHHIEYRVAEGIDRLAEELRQRSQTLVSQSARAVERVAVGLVDLTLVLLIAIYLLVYLRELRHRFLDQVSPGYVPYLQGFQRDLNRVLGGFIRGQLSLAIFYGITAGLICLGLRLPFALLIGIFVAVASFVPIIGPYIGAAPAVLLALLASPWKLFWVVLLFFVMNEAGSKVLYPRLVGQATGLHAVVVLFALLAGAEAAGIWGALLAVPLTAFVGLVVLYSLRIWRAGLPLPPSGITVAPHAESDHAPHPEHVPTAR
jgi:predicted PurR-regulated permease PerM